MPATMSRFQRRPRRSPHSPRCRGRRMSFQITLAQVSMYDESVLMSAASMAATSRPISPTGRMVAR